VEQRMMTGAILLLQIAGRCFPHRFLPPGRF
jgi:hypothetical protein